MGSSERKGEALECWKSNQLNAGKPDTQSPGASAVQRRENFTFFFLVSGNSRIFLDSTWRQNLTRFAEPQRRMYFFFSIFHSSDKFGVVFFLWGFSDTVTTASKPRDSLCLLWTQSSAELVFYLNLLQASSTALLLNCIIIPHCFFVFFIGRNYKNPKILLYFLRRTQGHSVLVFFNLLDVISQRERWTESHNIFFLIHLVINKFGRSRYLTAHSPLQYFQWLSGA